MLLKNSTRQKRFRPQEWGAKGGIVAGGLFLLLVVMEMLNLLPSLDAHCYDYILKTVTPYRGSRNEDILLLESHPQNKLSEKDALKLLGMLSGFKAKHVVFTYTDDDWGQALYEKAARMGNVTFAREIQPTTSSPGTFELEPLPYEGTGVKWGIAGMPSLQFGSFKRFQTHSYLSDGTHKNLESVVYEELTGETVSKASMLIDFAGPPGSLPQLFMADALDRGLSAQLVKGRCVLVGHLHEYEYLKTPISDTPMSLLEFRGNTLASLLDKTAIVPLSKWQAFGLTLMLLLVSAIVYPHMKVSISTVLTIVIGATILVSSVILLFTMRIWLPIGHLLVAQTVLWVAMIRLQLSRNERSMTQMSLSSFSRIHTDSRPQAFYDDDQFFSHVAKMILQLLPVTRMVVFETDAYGERADPRFFYKCTPQDYEGELRPLTMLFAHAQSERSAVCLTGFFGNDMNAPCYACPLVVGGKRLGTWVVELEAAGVADVETTEAMLMDLALQVAELLRQKYRIVGRSNPSVMERVKGFFSQDYTEREGVALMESVERVENQYKRLESLFEGISTATLVYDLFGRLLHANEAMSIWAQKCGLRVFEMTAIDFLEKVSEMDGIQLREQLLRVVRSRETISLLLTNVSGGSTDLILTVRPLVGMGTSRVDYQPFDIGGVIFELNDVTLFNQLSQLRGTILGQLGTLVRHDVGVVDMSCEVLGRYKLTDDQQTRVLLAVKEKATHLNGAMAACEEFLVDMFSDANDRPYPVDVLSLFEISVGQLRPTMEEREVTLSVQCPHVMSYAFAKQAGLQRFLSAIFQFLLNDSQPGTAIEVDLHEDGSRIHFHFVSHGFGILAGQIEELLADVDGSTLPEADRELWRSVRDIRDWGGLVSVSSGVGKGFVFNVELQRFR